MKENFITNRIILISSINNSKSNRSNKDHIILLDQIEIVFYTKLLDVLKDSYY